MEEEKTHIVAFFFLYYKSFSFLGGELWQLDQFMILKFKKLKLFTATGQMSQEEDNEQNLNEYEHYQNANTGTNFNDAYKNDYQMDTDLSYRIAGYDSKKGYRQLAKEEVAKAPVENSEMYQGMLAVDNFLEVTAGTLSSKAKQSQEDMAFEELKRKQKNLMITMALSIGFWEKN